MELRSGEHLLELDDPTSSSMAPIFSDTWLGTELWPAARALVALLEERRTALASAAQVLELGAGTGACGLAAAALGAWRVLLTDKPVLLPLMRANVAANRFDSGGGLVNDMAWSPDGTVLAVANSAGFHVLAADRGGAEVCWLEQGTPVHCCCFDSTGAWLATGTANGVTIWDASTWKLAQTLLDGLTTAVCFSPARTALPTVCSARTR